MYSYTVGGETVALDTNGNQAGTSDAGGIGGVAGGVGSGLVGMMQGKNVDWCGVKTGAISGIVGGFITGGLVGLITGDPTAALIGTSILTITGAALATGIITAVGGFIGDAAVSLFP